MTTFVDTFRIHEILTKEVGFEEEKAKAFVRLFDDENFDVAKKSDIARVEREIASVKSELKSELIIIRWVIGVGFTAILAMLILIFDKLLG